MTIPTDQMLPLLQVVADGADHRLTDLVPAMADHFHLTEDEQTTMLPSGNSRVFHSRVTWAMTYLKQAALLAYAGRGVVRITPDGTQVVRNSPHTIDVDFLSRYPTFRAFRERGTDRVPRT